MEKDKQEGKRSNVAPITEGKKNNITAFVLIFIAGLVIGVLTAPLIWERTSHEDVIADTGSVTKDGTSGVIATDTAMTEDASGYSISVDDQLAGDRVLLSNATFAKTGWAVVHEDNNGALGNALGAQRLEPGTHENVHVELLRNTETGNLYHVVLYTDNGDGEFSLKTDLPLRNTDNSYVEDTFTTVQIDRKN